MVKLYVPSTKSKFAKLKAGEEVLVSGIIYTARDQTHKRLVKIINNNEQLPFDLRGQIIYYCGPTETPKGKIIGSCGPTTSTRMDYLTQPLLKKGLLGMIGKGRRIKKIRNLIKATGAVYFLAPSGCGALLAKRVLAREVIAFKDLGPEGLYRLTIRDFPLIVGIDSYGRSILADLDLE
ncbi:MAG: fumarate hydratase C-terminal domain-containing protein [Candidatus Omnitrophica bacterium]|jgi:fumarate hydratase subunit beta|nr:fumarate hydratase C-terminal domain-containing protein [Candidatus Omnitrophota bacterium]